MENPTIIDALKTCDYSLSKIYIYDLHDNDINSTHHKKCGENKHTQYKSLITKHDMSPKQYLIFFFHSQAETDSQLQVKNHNNTVAPSLH